MTGIVVNHDGLRFRCRLDGREGAPWIVFSNSLVTDLTVWDAQVAAFGDRYRILRYDQRGHGGTDVPNGPATITQLSEDAAALMVHFGVTGAVFCWRLHGGGDGFLPCAPKARPHRAAGGVGRPGSHRSGWGPSMAGPHRCGTA